MISYDQVYYLYYTSAGQEKTLCYTKNLAAYSAEFVIRKRSVIYQ